MTNISIIINLKLFCCSFQYLLSTWYLGPPMHIYAQGGNSSPYIFVDRFQIHVFPTLIYTTEIFFEGSSPCDFWSSSFCFPQERLPFRSYFCRSIFGHSQNVASEFNSSLCDNILQMSRLCSSNYFIICYMIKV